MIDLRVGNCIDVLAAEPDASFDAIVLEIKVDSPVLYQHMASVAETNEVAWHRVCERAGVEPQFLGIDICPEAVEIAKARLAWWRAVRLDVEPTKPREEVKDDRQRSLF